MDGLSRERRNATTIKRKLLTMLLVFAVVATYIPFDRAFAANENGKGHGKQVERTEGKDASKKTQVSKKSEPVKQATDHGKEAKEGRAVKPKPVKEKDGKEYATVTFDKYGGVGGPAPIRVVKGTAIGIDNFPDQKDFPKRYGYYCRFWDLTKRPFNGELLFYFFWDTLVYSDTTVYPLWESKEIQVYLDTQGGSEISETEPWGYTWGFFGYKYRDFYPDCYGPFNITTKEGYKFLGWAKSKDATEPNVTEDTVVDTEGPLMLYAVWKEDKVHVSFNANGGEGAPEKAEVIRKKSLGSSFPAGKPTRAGHVFLGWAKSPHATSPDFFSDTPVPEKMTVYAVWRAGNAEEVTVNFDVNGGNGSGTSVKIQKGNALEEKFPTLKPERDGYTFKGWSLNRNATKADFFRGTEVNANTTVYAVWKPNTSIENVTVTFNGNGEKHSIAMDNTPPTGVPPAVTVDKGSTLSDKFPKSKPKGKYVNAFVFLGWAKSPDATVPDFFEDTEINNNMTVYAVWAVNYYINHPVTVWFDVNGGAGNVAPVYVASGTSLSALFPEEKPTKSGYVFKGWSKSASATKPDFNKDSVVSGDWTVYAVYEKPENVVPGDQEKPEGYVTITFDLDGKGTTSDPVKCHVKKNTDVTAIAPNVVANTGFRHTGWNKPLKGKFSVDTTIKATYENVADVVTPEDGEKPDGYSMVTFELANKGTTEGKTVYYVNPGKDVKLAAPAVKAAKGYKHTGWKIGGESWDSETARKYPKDTTITAQYDKRKQCMVTFEADGRTLRVDYVEEGDTLGNVPEAPAKEGHKFIGWQESGVGNVYTGEAIKNIKITENKLYIAKYEEVASGQHMVRFVVDGTVVHIESVVNNGKLADVPDNPNVSGYIFRGWQKDGAGKLYSKAELKNLAVKSDLTLVAKLDKEEDIMVPETPDTPKPSEE